MTLDLTANGDKDQDLEAGGDVPEAAEPSPAAHPDDYPTGATLALIVVALGTSMFLVALNMTIIATAVPKITDEFHSLEDIAWYGSAFFVTSGGFQSSCGLSALLIVICYRIPSWAKPAEASWPEKLLQMDPLGTLLALGAIVSYILAMQYGGQSEPWDSSKVIGLLVGFVIIAAAFVSWEIYAGERAMMPPRLMKQRVVWFNATWAFLLIGAYFTTVYYLPVYFQSIDGLSPTASGVRSLPLILTTSVAIILLGMTVKYFGSYTMLAMAFCAALAAVAIGLMITFDIGTSLGREVGYQLLAGFALGFPFQLPVIHGQTQSKPKDLAVVTAIIVFSETIAGAILLSAAQCAFVNQMLKTLAVTAPAVDPAKLIATGVSEIREAFPADQIPGILLAYMDGLRIPFAIATATAGDACILTCILIGVPTRLRKKASGGCLISSNAGPGVIEGQRPASK
ncbi:hypothetical protein SLS63_010590 [Diaporthe eres]|uniref:Uncharacterized protein n=1 Tax=Diaporthe eres TaxID=83184 RepID=A0ABR1NWB6_DIAER